jgi:hypothetical protein
MSIATPRMKLITLLAGAVPLLCTAQLIAEVVIEARPGPLTVRSSDYKAIVDWDGCLTNLQIHGVEFLNPHVSISRGTYFFQGGPLKLAELDQRSSDVITASSDAAAIEYRFSEETMEWTVENRSEEPMVFFFVLAADVNVVRHVAGELLRAPITKDVHELIFFRDSASLTIKGLDRVWGPWEGPHQVAQVDLAPGERKEITLEVARTSRDVRNEMAALLASRPEQKLTMLSPRPYQVFQRRTRAEGEILISGRCQEQADSIEVRITGNSTGGELPNRWHSIEPVTTIRQFNLRLMVPAGGWYTLETVAKRAGTVVAEATVDRFGVGEVFVGAGQSNSTNCGEFKTSQQTGMVSSFDGTHWQLADDPQPGAADNSQGGSFWPAFGDAMYEKYHVPIGVAVTGFGGTSVNQWQPDGDLFNWMMTRVYQLGPTGFRALLWHQGESDVGMSTDEYYLKLKNVICTSRDKAGWEFPWQVAQTSYHNAEQARDDSLRNAQQRLWTESVALRGPDTDTLTGDHRDMEGEGIHLSPKGLKSHGQMWAERVSVYVDEMLQSDRKQSP